MVGQQQDDDADAETFPCQRVFLHRLFVQPFFFVVPFLSSLLLFVFFLLLLPGFAVFLLGGGTWRCVWGDTRWTHAWRFSIRDRL